MYQNVYHSFVHQAAQVCYFFNYSVSVFTNPVAGDSEGCKSHERESTPELGTPAGTGPLIRRPCSFIPSSIIQWLTFLSSYHSQNSSLYRLHLRSTLLDYDHVFLTMGVPACLWRRTGEIYKGNHEFSELVGVDGYMMRDVSCLDVAINACNDLRLLRTAAYVSTPANPGITVSNRS
jgi:hypothetical protein